MTLRRLLVIPLLASLVLLLYYSSSIAETFLYILRSVEIDSVLVLLLVLAVIFQLIGHGLRSKKASLLFSPIESSRASTQLRAFGVGQLFNNILPLRLGEFIRTAIISQKLNISYLYTFSLIVIERSIDVIFISIGVLALLIITVEAISPELLWMVGTLLALGLLGVVGILLLKSPPLWLLRIIYTTTKVFNPQVKNSIRFKLWSLSYGLNRSLSRNVLSAYLPLTIAMWFTYLVSTLMIAIAVFKDTTLFQDIVVSFAPYIGIAAPAGPAGLGVFSSNMQLVTKGITSESVLLYAIISWCIILLPISIIGLVSITKTTEPIWKKRKKGSSDMSLANKLIRNEDISDELEHFLEGYYKGNRPSLIVNHLEHEGELRLVKYFRGGSDAITILTLQGKKRVVKKIIPIELKDRLKAQYDWLETYSNDTIVSVSNEKTTDDYYSIDIAYDKTSLPMFNYVHEIPLRKAQNLLVEAWRGLSTTVYSSAPKRNISDPEMIESYIQKHIIGCTEIAGKVDVSILEAAEPDQIIINGITYDNLHQILARIRKHPVAWRDLSSYTSAPAVHGDMILDNLLYSQLNDKIIIIDPAPDGNIIEGPVFDFGKAAQSLYCGYEFLLRDETPVEYKNGQITFNETKSVRYSELDIFMRDTLAKKYLSEGEQKAILFHAGALFIRRLKHQVHYTPENTLKFYAVGVRTLNQFLDQYDEAA